MSASMKDDDPKRGWLSGIAAYTDTIFEAKRYQETRTDPGTGEPKFGCTVIFVGPVLIKRNTDTLNGAIRAVINDVYPTGKMPPRGLRGVKQQPLLKKVTDYPKMWPDCPDPDACFVRLGSLQAPTLVNADGEILTPEAARVMIRPGSLIHILFNCYHYEKGGDPGVALGLNAVKYGRPGPYKLGAGVSPAEAAAGPGVDEDQLFADLNI